MIFRRYKVRTKKKDVSVAKTFNKNLDVIIKKVQTELHESEPK